MKSVFSKLVSEERDKIKKRVEEHLQSKMNINHVGHMEEEGQEFPAGYNISGHKIVFSEGSPLNGTSAGQAVTSSVGITSEGMVNPVNDVGSQGVSYVWNNETRDMDSYWTVQPNEKKEEKEEDDSLHINIEDLANALTNRELLKDGRELSADEISLIYDSYYDLIFENRVDKNKKPSVKEGFVNLPF